MKKTFALCAALTFLGSLTALAGPTKKVTDLWVCPIQGEVIKDHSTAGKGKIVDGRYIHFCCGGCEPAFNKLSKKEQEKKVAEAIKKEKTVKQ